MKLTKLKISVSQDGLLPEETAEIGTVNFPNLPKKLLAALGFERVDANTFVGVVPVFINLGGKVQEIEFELGVEVPELRKKVLEIVRSPFKTDEDKARSARQSADNVIELTKSSTKNSKKTSKSKKKTT